MPNSRSPQQLEKTEIVRARSQSTDQPALDVSPDAKRRRFLGRHRWTLYGQNTASNHFLRSGESFVVVRGAAPDPTATQTRRVGLGRRSFVVPKQSSKSFTADHIARAATNHRARLNDAVLETLVISFFVIVRQIRRHHAAQRVFTKKNHSAERLALNGSHGNAPGAPTFWATAEVAERT